MMWLFLLDVKCPACRQWKRPWRPCRTCARRKKVSTMVKRTRKKRNAVVRRKLQGSDRA